MTNNELRDAITWTEEKIKEVDKSTEETSEIEKRIIEAGKRIKQITGNIRWQNNRSRQSRTICERGF